MKRQYFTTFFAVACSTLLISCGSSTDGVSVPGEPSGAVSTDVYEVNSEALVEGRSEVVGDVQLNDVQFLVEQGAVLSVIDQTEDGMIRVGIDNPDADTDATATIDIWLSQATFANLDLSVLDNADPYDEDGYEIDELSEFARKKMTYCYKYVKQYLLKIGLVKVYLPGGSAYMAAGILPKHGFKKVNRKPANAIVNDVCVYKGGTGGHGHIEILTSKGWYYGYGYKKSPIKNRPLIACFHK